MKYISPEEGIAINVSYGSSMLHSQTVKTPDPQPTCLNVFTKIAQMCARFSELLPTDDGLRGCINLEPMLLGEVNKITSYDYESLIENHFILDSIGITYWLFPYGSKWDASDCISYRCDQRTATQRGKVHTMTNC